MLRLKGILSLAVLLPLFTGCVDDKYDLSDIDTTVKVNVDNLTVPVNIDQITLGNILKPDENQIEIVDGQYAIVYDGTFTSQGIKINEIELKAPTINASETTISLQRQAVAMSRAQSDEFTYPLASATSDFNFTSNSAISDFIMGITRIGADMQLDIAITLKGLEDIVSRITLKNVVLQIPKGLNLTEAQGNTYDPVSGELTMPASRVITGNTLNLSLRADSVDFKQADGTFDSAQRLITVPGSFYIKSGTANIAAADINAGTTTLPPNIVLRTDYILHDTRITSFSGTINRYNIDGANLTDVDLSNLPDILSQHATDITLVNPMIYLQVNNPLQPYGDIYAETALKIDAFHGNTASAQPFESDRFRIGDPVNASGIYNMCLSPHTPIADADFPEAQHIGFASLGSVLSGDEIPARLSVSLNSPNLPAGQTVSNFPLSGPDNAIEAFGGKYKLVAPLQFAQGSTITYSDKIDGWYSEDMDNLTITALEISLTVSTDIPVGVEFTGYPINEAGQKINNVDIVGATIEPKANKQKVTIRTTGEFSGLNGIAFEAKAKTAANGAVLTPDMNITLTDIRPKVSGYYEKEL